MPEEGGKGKNNKSKSKSKSKKGKAKTKTKAKAKAKAKAKSGNHIRDGSPVCDLSGTRQATDSTDPWDDWHNAWVVENSQSTKGGAQGTHQNQNQNHSQKQKRQKQHQNNNNNIHPNGQHQSGSTSAQNRRGRGGHLHAGQKRKATEDIANDITGTDDGDRVRTPKRHKSEKRPRLPPSSRSSPVPDPNTDSPDAHPDFWYPDGSVIIQVENTKFRLHRTKLQNQSAYFAAAFREKGSQKRGGRAYLEVEVNEQNLHIPVYRVTETTANDFATLLTVIEGTTWMKYAVEIPPMPVLAGVLRAASALSFKAQRIWAEGILERMWPGKLGTLTADPIPHAAVALELARTCCLRGVQKRASYELVRMPTFGQAVVAAPAAHVEEQEESRADADAEMGPGELPRADLLRLLHAREQLVLAWAEIAGGAPTDFVCPRGTQTQTKIMPKGGGGSSNDNTNDGRRSGCASANADRVHARWTELVHTTGLYVRGMVDPLMGVQDLVDIPWKEEGFCKKCVAARTNAWDKFRRRLWDDLDVWLQLTTAKND